MLEFAREAKRAEEARAQLAAIPTEELSPFLAKVLGKSASAGAGKPVVHDSSDTAAAIGDDDTEAMLVAARDEEPEDDELDACEWSAADDDDFDAAIGSDDEHSDDCCQYPILSGFDDCVHTRQAQSDDRAAYNARRAGLMRRVDALLRQRPVVREEHDFHRGRELYLDAVDGDAVTFPDLVIPPEPSELGMLPHDAAGRLDGLERQLNWIDRCDREARATEAVAAIAAIPIDELIASLSDD